MESARDVLERRYVSRTLSARDARALSREASRRGDEDAAREQKIWEQQNVSACAEIAKIAKIARDLGIALDTHALRERAIEREAEIEETLNAFEAARSTETP